MDIIQILNIPDLCKEILQYFNLIQINGLKRVSKTFCNICHAQILIRFRYILNYYIRTECNNDFDMFCIKNNLKQLVTYSYLINNFCENLYIYKINNKYKLCDNSYLIRTMLYVYLHLLGKFSPNEKYYLDKADFM